MCGGGRSWLSLIAEQASTPPKQETSRYFRRRGWKDLDRLVTLGIRHVFSKEGQNLSVSAATACGHDFDERLAQCDRDIVHAFERRLAVAALAARHCDSALSESGEEVRARRLRREARAHSPAVSDEAVEVLHDCVVDLTRLELGLA